MKLLGKIARVTIGDDIFLSGDGELLPDIEVTLGENQRSSSCSFAVYDPELKIGAKYQKISLQAGGILVPDLLLNPPKPVEVKPQGEGITDNSAGTLQTSGGGNKDENIKLIVAECVKQGVTDPKQVAYILATVQHESDFMPIDEIGGSAKWYAPYFGRGFVQLTHRENYQKYSTKLNQDFVKNPNGVKDPRVSAYILVDGMKNGIFTGAKLGQFIGGGKADYYNARTIVNGYDRAELIAGYARQWESKAVQLLAGKTNLTQTTNPVIQNIVDKIKKVEEVTESSVKGTEIIIEIGFNNSKKLTAFHFIHVGTRTEKGKINRTIFEGLTIRWLLSRVPQNTAYENVNLKTLTELVTKNFGISVQMEGLGQKYNYVEQNGITTLQLLQREASKIGYKITDSKATLVLEPEAKPKFSNFLIDEETLISVSFTDKARGSKPIPYQAISNPYETKETKFNIDRKTGEVKQISGESFAGTPQQNATAPNTTTGANTPSITGVVNNGGENYGLPKQLPGKIELENGRVEAQVIADESKRIRGYEANAVLMMTEDTLEIVPGEIIGLSSRLFPEPFNREWRVYTVKHSFKSCTTELVFYTPQGLEEDSDSVIDSSSSQGAVSLAGDINTRLYKAALALRGASSADDGSGGNLACVYMLNKVFAKAGVKNPWGTATYVPTAEAALKAQGQSVPRDKVATGDIAIFNNEEHIGIVTQAGGTIKILSNSSSKAAFVWEGTVQDYEQFYGGKTRFYRVTKG